MEWKTSADRAVAELSRPDREEAYRYFSVGHVKVKQRAKEMQGSRTTQWCWRSYLEQRPHTVVLKASADHAVAEFQRQKTVFRVSAMVGARASAEWLTTSKWHWRKRERATDRKAAFSNVTLLGFRRILVRSDNVRTLLSLIEPVMSNLTGVELVQCS